MKNLFLFIPEIRELLATNQLEPLKTLLTELHPVEIAKGFEELNEEEQLSIFKLLDDEVAISLFEELDFELQSRLLASMSKEKAIHVLDEMSPDERADFFTKLSQEQAKRFFSLMKKEEVDDVIRLLKYKEDTAGGIMTTDFIALPSDMDVDQAITCLRGKIKAESISYIYVTEGDGYLKGVVSIRRLIMAKSGATLREIMNPDPISVLPDLDQEEVARMVADYNLLAIPVVDNGNRIIGIVTVDDCIDVLNKEASEDVYKMAGAKYEEEVLKAPPLRATRLRFPWIFICLFGELTSALIIKFFNFALKEVIALASFIPVIMAMGGNVGTQSSTVIVRGIATGDVDLNRVGKLLLREAMIGFLMGVLFGIIVGAVAPFFHLGNYMFGVVVGLSLSLALTVATFCGGLLPIVLKKCGVDPAVATGPFITTVVDITGVSIYLSLATLFLRYLVK